MENKEGKGFTLIEIILAMAIVAILSAAVLTSLGAQRTNARVSRLVGELSAMIQPMLMCLGEGQSLDIPASGDTSGGAICSGVSASWPDISTLGAAYGSSNVNAAGNWRYQASVDGRTVCCNSLNMSCFELTSGNCNVNTPSPL